MKAFIIPIVLILFFAHSFGILDTPFAQISSQKTSPAKPAEQAKEFQAQPERQFQVTPSIKVIYPNGGETWEKGKTYTIRWTSQNVQQNITIYLQWYGGPSYTVAQNIPNTGSYNYTVPELGQYGDKFLVIVASSDGAISDWSDKFFTISKAGPITPVTPTGKITVLSPNGGETWEKGKTYTIRWTSENVPENEKISILLQWDRRYDSIYHVATNIPNTGSYNFTVPDLGKYGDKYQACVHTITGVGKGDCSDNFFRITDAPIRISPPVIRFITPQVYKNPNTRETLVRGKPYTISWRQERETKVDLRNIKILLENRRLGQKFWVTENSPNRGYYTYTIPSNVPDGIYTFHIMPLTEEFRNQSPEFYIGPNNDVDLIIELRNVAVVWTDTYFFVGTKSKDYVEFEIWVMNRGKKLLPLVPIAWRIINEPNNVVILQNSAGFSDVYPNRYYKTKLRYTFHEASGVFFYHSEKGWGPGPFIIEAEADAKRITGEMEMMRGDNIFQTAILYDMHIKGRKEY